MSEFASLRLVHSLPGRVRLRVEAVGEEPVDLSSWERRLRALPGVTEVRANPAAHSLLVFYDSAAFNPGRELNLTHRAGSGTESAHSSDLHPLHVQREHLHAAPSSTTAHSLMQSYWDADAKLRERTGGRMDLKLAIPLAFLGIGLVDALTAGEAIGVGFHAMAWYAYNIFYHMHFREFRPAQVSGDQSSVISHQ